MNLGELITLTRQYGKHIPGYLEAPSREENINLLNQALRWFGRYTHIYDPMISFAPEANRQQFALRDTHFFGKLITKAYRVYLSGVPVEDETGVNRVMAISELDDYNNWRGTTAGRPRRAAESGNGALFFDRPFDETTASDTPHEVFGEYLPGVITPDGVYLPEGFPVSLGSEAPSSGQLTGTPSVIGSVYDPYSGLINAPAGCLAVGGTSLNLTYYQPPTAPNNLLVKLSGLGLELPTGAMVQWVRVKSFRARSVDGAVVRIRFGANVNVPLGGAAQELTVLPSVAYAEYGPLPEVTSLGAVDAESANFGIQLDLQQYVDPESMFAIPATDVLVEIDSLSIEVAYTTPGGGSGTMTWDTAQNLVPDIPLEYHEILAYVAAVTNANPNITSDQVVANIQNINAQIAGAVRQFKNANKTTLAGLHKPQSTNHPSRYKVGR
jgi:hypothetical protein